MLAYLYLIVRADRIATAWIVPDGDPRIEGFGGDIDYCTHVAGQIAGIDPVAAVIQVGPGGTGPCRCASIIRSPECTSCNSVRHIRRCELAEEIRLVIELGAGRRFIGFLGRSNESIPWSAEEFELARRSLSLIHSIVIAHDRCLNSAQPKPPTQISAERRLVRAFEQRGLTRRESEIASKVLFGYSTLAIAMEFGISEHTVKVHRKHLNQKLGVRSQGELFGFAYKTLMDGERL